MKRSVAELKMKFFLLFALSSILVLFSCENKDRVNIERHIDTNKLIWHWEDNFSEADSIKLTQWITEVYTAAVKTLGVFPFDLHIHFYNREQATEPVPWAHTRRSTTQSLHFHVDPSYSFKEFMDDWTAPHEISHVALPFLGRKYSWFAEGFASYMQYKVMASMEVITEAESERRLFEKFRQNKNSWQDDTLAFPDLSRKLVREYHNYPAMYWGGATYFYNLNDSLLTNIEIDLEEFLALYQDCCRKGDGDINDLMFSLDSLSGMDLCTKLFEDYEQLSSTALFENFEFDENAQ